MNYFKHALQGNDRPGRRATHRLFEALFEQMFLARDFYPAIHSIYENEWKRSPDWLNKRIQQGYTLPMFPSFYNNKR